MSHCQPLINNLAQRPINFHFVTAMTARTYNPRTATDKTLVFFGPFNNLDVFRAVGHIKDLWFPKCTIWIGLMVRLYYRSNIIWAYNAASPVLVFAKSVYNPVSNLRYSSRNKKEDNTAHYSNKNAISISDGKCSKSRCWVKTTYHQLFARLQFLRFQINLSRAFQLSA